MEGKRMPAGMWRLDGCILVGVCIVAGMAWGLGALSLVSSKFVSCAVELGVVEARESLEWALLRLLFYMAASWLAIVLIRLLLRRSVPLRWRVVGLACLALGAFFLTWGELALYAQLRFKWGEALLFPRFGANVIQCQGELPSLWPDWLPFPSPRK